MEILKFSKEGISNCNGMPLRITGAVRLKIEQLGWLEEFNPYMNNGKPSLINYELSIRLAKKLSINIHESWHGAEFVQQEITIKDLNVIMAIYKVFLMMDVKW